MSMSPVELRNALSAAAILGTERAPVSLPSDGGLGKLLGALDRETPEARFLLSAGVVTLYEAAGARPAVAASAPLEAAPEEADRSASAQSGSHLYQILESKEPALLVDWAQTAIRVGRRVPDEVLPAVLDLCSRQAHESWVDEVLPALGAHGRWLSSANPEWAIVAADFDSLSRRWTDASASVRAKMLRRLRRLDAARARDLLISTIADEAADDRAAQLAALGVGLSIDDEPFLEASLDDSSKVVRAAASDLLARIPGSALGLRMAEQGRALVQIELQRKLVVKKSLKLEVALPESTKELTRDGVENRKFEKLGNKAWMLAQIIGAAPLGIWTESPGVTPAALVAAAEKSEWVEPLLLGWVIAAGRQRRAAWSQELVRSVLASETAATPLLVDQLADLVIPLDAATREESVGACLAGRKDGLTDLPAWKALLACDHAWSGPFTSGLIRALGGHFKRIAGGWDPALDTAAAVHIAIHASLPDAARETAGWTDLESSSSPSTRRWISGLLLFLQLRRDYLKELAS